MSIRNRWAKIRKRAEQFVPKPKRHDPDEEEWLTIYDEEWKQGQYDSEPDFPIALEFYREALARARAQTDPPFDPPPTFMPELMHLPTNRLWYWRTESRFPDVETGLTWLTEMALRVYDGIPPVTTVEFDELAQWFFANRDRLEQNALPNGCLDLGGGRWESGDNISYNLHQGARKSRAGEVAEMVRCLQGQYGLGVEPQPQSAQQVSHDLSPPAEIVDCETEPSHEAVRNANNIKEELDRTVPIPLCRWGEPWNWDDPAEARRALQMVGLYLEDYNDETLAAVDHPAAKLLREYRLSRTVEIGSSGYSSRSA